jgi:hypothetical protein
MSERNKCSEKASGLCGVVLGIQHPLTRATPRARIGFGADAVKLPPVEIVVIEEERAMSKRLNKL